MLSDVIDLLECPHCGRELTLAGAVVRCADGHAFDVARQGYVTLVPAAGGDGAEMVAARDFFLEAGHYAPIADAVAERTADGPVMDLGAGTGHYLARALGDRRAGLALESSTYALRRAARAHERIGAVGCDVWRELPVRDAAVGTALCVFSPRNGAEVARVLRPGGELIVVAPTQRHLHELVAGMGLLTVDPRKAERMEATLGPHLERGGSEALEFELSLAPADVRALVAMGPSAHHDRTPDAAELPPRSRVTASVEISTWRR